MIAYLFQKIKFPMQYSLGLWILLALAIIFFFKESLRIASKNKAKKYVFLIKQAIELTQC